MSNLEREADRFADQPALTGIRWGVMVIAVIVVLGLFAGVAKFALGWFGAAANVVGPANVQEQYRGVIEDYQGLKQAAANACGARNAPAYGNSPELLEDPEFAYAARYRGIAVDYDRRWANIFEAKAVGPSGYPHEAPPLDVMQRQVC